jgi:AmiR/NasT family two-component response regulator
MPEHAAKLSDCRVLVVEDEPIVALEVADALVQEGAIVVGPASRVATPQRLSE